ncbi:hypothetical protein SDC9_137926 [bioreactor metagenome]|uniref:HTH cro/C1-type domain-containing protein n=1 Tax=bioreactor metagenome TaxID=1076179 RepID=A0A645DMX7_9ZZZZ
MTFGERLKELREKRNLTQQDIADFLNIGRPTVAGYETKGKQPDYDKLNKLADFFNVSVDYLLGRTEEKSLVAKDIKNENETKPVLTAKDEKDIAKDVESLRVKLKNKEDGPALFNGEEISEDGAELFLNLFEVALRNIKIKNKETYTPKKYKK